METAKKILDCLKRDARLSSAQIAERLNLAEEKVRVQIRKLEDDGVIRGYTVITSDHADEQVRAIIEVQVQPQRDTGFNDVAEAIARFPEVNSVYLVSGGYDLRLEVVGDSLQDVANFVATKLSSLDGVKGTATSFLLKKYKEAGVPLTKEEKYERLQIVP